MVVDGFVFGIGLVWIVGSSLLVSSLVFCGATTLVLCGTTIVVLCGTHHPLWLPFHLIGWFGRWVDFGLSSGDNLGQGCEATILGRVVCVAICDPVPFNELFFALGF
jgi:hypothetical protein